MRTTPAAGRCATHGCRRHAPSLKGGGATAAPRDRGASGRRTNRGRSRDFRLTMGPCSLNRATRESKIGRAYNAERHRVRRYTARLDTRGDWRPLRAAVRRPRISRPDATSSLFRAQSCAALDAALDQDWRLSGGLRLLSAERPLRDGDRCIEAHGCRDRARRGAGGQGPGRPALLHGRRLARAQGPRSRSGLRHGCRRQGARARDLHDARHADRRSGAPAQGGRSRLLQPQSRHRARVLRCNHRDAHLPGPARHARSRARRRDQSMLRRHRRHGRKPRASRRSDRGSRQPAGAPRERADQHAGQSRRYAARRCRTARRTRIRAHSRGSAHLHAEIDGAAFGGPREHERGRAGAVLPRRRQFDLLRRATADDAQSGARRGSGDDGTPWPVADGAVNRAETATPSAHAAGLDHLWLPYAQMQTAPAPLPVARTEGCRIHLADGRVLIDGIASWWTACHGYNHPHIREAVSRQLQVMPHVMFGGFTHDPAERLAARLASLLPGALDHVFFTDSGSVAVEVAMKMAVQFWLNRGQTGRTRFLAFHEGYHGDTLGAMSVCDPEDSMHAHFEGWLPRQLFAALPRDATSEAALDALLAEHAPRLAAVILEPLVQGAGGMRFHEPATLAAAARLAHKHGLLLIADEIFTGFGRTGTMFAVDQAGVVPDIVCLSKALTGGTMALAATVATSEVFEAFWSDEAAMALMHGPTFMANP